LRSPTALVANVLEIDSEQIFENLKAIQKQNNIPEDLLIVNLKNYANDKSINVLGHGLNFSVEMEKVIHM
jgi:ketopantoate reductase